MRGPKLLKNGKTWRRLSELLVSASQFLICSREECTHTRKHKRKEKKPCTNHEKIYDYKYQLDLGWGQGACCFFCSCISCEYVFLYVCWYFKSKLTSDWLWGNLRSRSFQEYEWIISSFSWLWDMGSSFFSFTFTACSFGSLPCVLHANNFGGNTFSYYYYDYYICWSGETVCEWTRLK